MRMCPFLLSREGCLPTVTRKDLAEIVVADLGCSTAQAKEMVDAFFEVLVESIARGNKIEIRGFGSWTVRWQNANPNARNPRTGERVPMAARRKVAFKAGKVIREVLAKPLGSDE